MNEQIRYEDALDESLRMMQAGVSIDDCARLYPQYEGRLRPQLEAARRIAQARPAFSPETPAQQRARARLLAEVVRERESAGAPFEPLALLALPLRGLTGAMGRLAVVPYALPAVLAMVILGGAAWGVSATTGSANPAGWFSGAQTRDASAAFRGPITSISKTRVTIDTPVGPVTAAITADTEFQDAGGGPLTLADFAVGDEVKMSVVRTEGGANILRKLAHQEELAPAATATPFVPDTPVPPPAPGGFDDVDDGRREDDDGGLDDDGFDDDGGDDSPGGAGDDTAGGGAGAGADTAAASPASAGSGDDSG
jgi:hypothetical protein